MYTTSVTWFEENRAESERPERENEGIRRQESEYIREQMKEKGKGQMEVKEEEEVEEEVVSESHWNSSQSMESCSFPLPLHLSSFPPPEWGCLSSLRWVRGVKDNWLPTTLRALEGSFQFVLRHWIYSSFASSVPSLPTNFLSLPPMHTTSLSAFPLSKTLQHIYV